MIERILIAGTGGQGVQVIAKLFAEAAAEEGRELIYTASYSGVQRGGDSTANLIVSDRPIGAPMILPGEITALLALSNEALTKYESYLAPGAVLILSTSSVTRKPEREDLRIETIDAAALATRAGSPRAANLAALGALLRCRPVVSPALIEKQISQVFAGKTDAVIEANRKAFRLGLEGADSSQEVLTHGSLHSVSY